MFAAERQFRASTRAHSVSLDGEILIWDGQREELHRLNPSASRIWCVLSTWQTVADVVASLAPHADRADLEHDVERCIDDLAAAGLLDGRAR
jgi:hypothetical protein